MTPTIKLCALILLLICNILLYIYAVMNLWNWFVVPNFPGSLELGMAHSTGMVFLMGLFNFGVAKEPRTGDLIERFLSNILAMSIMLGIGFLLK